MSKMELFAKMLDGIYLLNIFVKHFTLFVSQGYVYALIKLNEIVACCHLFGNSYDCNLCKFSFKFSFIFTLLPCREN